MRAAPDSFNTCIHEQVIIACLLFFSSWKAQDYSRFSKRAGWFRLLIKWVIWSSHNQRKTARWNCVHTYTWPISWAIVKAELKPLSSIIAQLLSGLHTVPNSARPIKKFVVITQWGWVSRWRSTPVIIGLKKSNTGNYELDSANFVKN